MCSTWSSARSWSCKRDGITAHISHKRQPSPIDTSTHFHKNGSKSDPLVGGQPCIVYLKHWTTMSPSWFLFANSLLVIGRAIR